MTSTTTTTSDSSNKKGDGLEGDDTRPTVSELLAQPQEEIVSFLGGIYEKSPWVAEAFVAGQQPTTNDATGARRRPTSIRELHTALSTIVNEASYETQLELLQAHPELCATLREPLSTESQTEQSRAGLLSDVTPEQAESFRQSSATYRQRFGFPFLLAVRHATPHTVFSSIAGRLAAATTTSQEFHLALSQVHKIAYLRLVAALRVDSKKAGFLTCHVLDTAQGCPAAHMRLTLHRISPLESSGLVGEFVTNADGRLPATAALRGLVAGTYEWTFGVQDYYAGQPAVAATTAGLPFLETVPVRFGMEDPEAHYHVPLLVSPWSYSTYRGS